MTNKFCAFKNKDEETIKEILQIAFDLKDSDFGEIDEVYKVFTANYNGIEANEIEVIEKSKFYPRTENTTFIEIFREESTNVGMDLPVWISPDNYSKTVFILAEDSLRNRSNQNVVFSTPFGVHMEKRPIHSDVIDFLLGLGYRVYLTDYYKVWVKKGKFKEKMPKDLLARFKECLQKEIEYFNPEFIITYGNPARNIIEQSKIETHHVSFPHPSAAANGEWKKILNKNSPEFKRCTPANKFNYIKLGIEGHLESF